MQQKPDPKSRETHYANMFEALMSTKQCAHSFFALGRGSHARWLLGRIQFGSDLIKRVMLSQEHRDNVPSLLNRFSDSIKKAGFEAVQQTFL